MEEVLTKWVDKQISLLECELAFERQRGDADVGRSTCPDKPVIKVLDVVSVTPSKGHYVIDCELNVSSQENYQYFSTGDIVGFVEGPKTVVLSGIIADFTAPHISVSVNNDPSNIVLQEEKKFSIIKLTSDVTFKRMKNALQYLKSPSGSPGDALIPLLFGNAQPVEVPVPPSLLKDGEIDFISGNLHASQKEAVAYSLKQKHIAIIQGPPGTGKTTTLVEIILQLVKAKQKVIVTAPSNIAVDNVLERLVRAKCRAIRLGHPARMPETFQQYSLDSVIASSDNAQILSEIRSEIREVSRKLRRSSEETRDSVTRRVKELRNEIKRRELKTQKDVLFKAEVVLCTLTTANYDGPLKLLPPDHFDVLVIDECSQGMEAACWIALPRASKVIMAGDHMQLPPTVLNPESTNVLSVSLMERAVKEWPYHMLTHQFRMNETIMKWVSEKIYNGQLTADASVAKHLMKDLPCVTENDETGTPMLFIDTAGMDYEESVDDEGSYSNEEEANIVAALVHRLLEANVPNEGIAVITPYSNQVQLLRSLLTGKSHVEVKTVDGFQGREKEAVILSLVRTNREGNLGFLTDKRRLNVAVSRARRFLGVVGDSVTVSNDETIKSLLDYIGEHGTVLTPDFYTGNEGAQKSVSQSSPAIKKLPGRTKTKPSKKESSSMPAANKTCNKDLSAQSRLHKSQQPTKPDSHIQDNNKELHEHVTSEATSTSDIKTTVSETEKWKLELEKIFLVPNGASEHHFKNLTSYERMLIHEAAENLNLEHESVGEGKNRYIVVRKPASKKQNCSEPSDMQKSDENKNENILCRTKSSNKGKIKDEDREANVPGTRKSDKPGVKKKNVNALDKLKDDDFDSVISHFQKMNTKCNYEDCRKSTELISSTCIHCRLRFCFEHALPEVHGCGEAARKHARQTFKHPPPVKSDDHHRNQKLKKLHTKLKEKNDERKAKTKNK
ncbi:DNA-binding protein SMUBP-2-like [Schistocerca piceifrons]|uniref:DNA-binding protein SMUBP-2-like n=1 Tax=Schistocerca piceifrons TaxID=274613 RepID=UPI001F5F32F5|nr:DNA-binding protein SMUBP-2-like [Schistocerca piceifrons]